MICAALWPDPADPLCPQTFREKAADLITAFALKATSRGKLADSCSQESMARWLTLAKPGNCLDPTNSAHLNVLRFALLDFIADFANWDNSTVKEYLETARLLTQIAHLTLSDFGFAIADLRLDPWSDKFREQIENLKSALENLPRPLVVDPFAGGGSIPLEALRVGADAFASDLNPVAVLLNKVVLEYIPKYGQQLADEVRKWGEWIKKEAGKELAKFYPKDPDGATPIAYLWARTITCEGPSCGAEVPLMRSLWLAKKGKRSVALQMKANRDERRVDFEIITNAKESEVGRGTCAGGTATCPVCGFTTVVESVRTQLTARRGGAHDARLIAVVINRPEETGQFFRTPTRRDKEAVEAAKVELKRRVKQCSDELPLIPHGPINHLRGFFNIVLYGITEWGDLFSPRQALTLSTFARLVYELPLKGEVAISDQGLIEAVKTCLALVVDRVAASVIGFLGNEAVALFRIKVGTEIGSAALIADGYHARVDGLTSLVVLFGAGGVWLGYPLADPIVGLLITAAILQIVWESGKAVFTRLLDGIEPTMLDEIKHAVNHIQGVHEVTEVRARWLGHRIHAEINLAVSPELSVEKAHEIAKEVRHQLLHHVRYLSDATIHVDPVNASGEEHHRLAEHVHDSLPVHSH